MKKIIAAILSLAAAAVIVCSLSSSAQTNSSDLQLLARAVNGEARGEPYEGQVAVAAVILNRVKHSSFPNTISGVIYQPGAFTAVSDGQINVPIDENSTVYKACRDAMNGWDPSYGAIYYFNPDTATNSWIWSRPLIITIGKHRFCS
ncbi:MAG: cell wall hydrolase [Clostridiales bacterium]|nr:cell wall hydrolase [Clostridiales bacterium]